MQTKHNTKTVFAEYEPSIPEVPTVVKNRSLGSKHSLKVKVMQGIMKNNCWHQKVTTFLVIVILEKEFYISQNLTDWIQLPEC